MTSKPIDPDLNGQMAGGMVSFKPSFAKTVEVNAKLLYASLLGAFSYWVWPSIPQDWGLGILSLLTGLSAVALALDAIRLIVKIQRFKSDQKECQAQGKQVKSSTLASQNNMTRDGVIRDV